MVTAADYQLAARTNDYQKVYTLDEPLVTICIPTFNRADLLMNRSLKSAIQQTYTNLEIIVVGDCCSDHTEEAVRQLNDPRIRFENLSSRGQYPDDPYFRWMVAGSIPTNRALESATGQFITHLDDDDEFTLDRIERLVEFAKQTQADLIYHPFQHLMGPDHWVLNDAEPLKCEKITTSSMFYHCWLKCILWDPNSYLLYEPGDWNKVRRMLELGVRTARYPAVLTWKY
ncbi:glycosyltransferase family 2 protein [Paenibacillus elgii]|uniref:glycosyltransferase family 2 protein n=1 Tax=Paenibacillus elgii TaxID=189691 RepID=UPI0020416C10|nr:glycosyltransferase family 2 protein [Paenibacillus elgii]MCM3270694.1 glycosyltransferase [Paenibacillus elgii]